MIMDQPERQPTRVSNACDRCRRQKQKCDNIRPCRVCIRAKSECITDQPAAKRRRVGENLNHGSNLLTPTPSYPTIDPPLMPQQPSLRRSTSNLTDFGTTRVTQDTSHVGDSPVVSEPNNLLENSRLDSAAKPHEGTAVLANLVGIDSAMGLTRKIFGLQERDPSLARETFAIPGGDSRLTRSPYQVAHHSVSVKSMIGLELPPRHICDQLLEMYFSTVHWFSLVVYEPTFRRRYLSIIGSGVAFHTDYTFILLLLMVLVMGCWYYPNNTVWQEEGEFANLDDVRARYLKVLHEHFIDVIDEDGIESVQLCALLGSFHLYHGRPRSSFSILGAAIRLSQAIGLHRVPDSRLTSEEIEERKRIWWTIYTWDRFATITYGRPLGINDKDCNVPMPLDVYEDITFRANTTSLRVCLSTYQTHLNRIYKIASPLLQNIYGIRVSYETHLQPALIGMISEAYNAMEAWQRQLPDHLKLGSTGDNTNDTSEEQKMHKLQALSLQLTHDNLMIVLHRPLLADRGQTSLQGMTFDLASKDLELYRNPQSTSFRRCLDAALRISMIQNEQTLVSLARSTHLVSFTGMNLFTASIVLFICAMSDSLSDVAQEAKRGLKRIYQLQTLLSSHASLSRQCSTILEDLIQLISKREMEEMLRGKPSPNDDLATESGGRDATGSSGGPVNEHSHSQPHMSSTGVGHQLNAHPASSDETYLRNSLLSLQRVFTDNANSWHDPTMNGASRSHGDQNASPTVAEATSEEYNTNPQSFMNGTGMEDLGQLWLWDFDIYN